MLVSAVICAHSLDSYDNLLEAVDSLLHQTIPLLEVIVVVDGNEELHRRLVAEWAGNASVSPLLLERNLGVSAARNAGIRVARGDVVAFTDDDAVADRAWVEGLLSTYRDRDAAAVGGKILPVWVDGRPDYLPEELYWLVGVTHEGFAGEGVAEVRNAFGPNMSFRREAFEQAGFFNEHLGFSRGGASCIQAEEPEFALRMKRELGKGVLYNPEAIVYHKIPRSKLGLRTLLRRSFYQGYSKALLRGLNISPGSMAAEKGYLRDVLLSRAPRRIARCYRVSELKKLLFLAASVLCVGLGFAYGYAACSGVTPAPSDPVRPRAGG